MARNQKEIIVEGISRARINSLISHWEKFKSCFFWTPPGSASGRRSEEKRQSEKAAFTVDGEPVTVEIEITCSCRNYYCDRNVVVDGTRKAQGLRYLKKLDDKGTFAE